MTEPINILLIEDDEIDALSVKRMLSKGFGDLCTIEWVSDWESGNQALAKAAHSVCLIDYRLGPDDGLDLVRQAVDGGCPTPIILLTGMNSDQIDIQAMEAGATDYISKDEMTTVMLCKSIRYAIARQQFQSDLIKTKKLLESKNKKLSRLYDTAHQFVDNVSHEFRTPLTVIKEFSSILADGLAGPLNEDQKEYLGIILNRTDDLGLMVDDMLDISKIEAGVLGVTRKNVPISDVFDRVRITLERKAANSEVDLEFDIPNEIGSAFFDPENIARVIINLGFNAIKFSGKNGKVKIWAVENHEQSRVEIGVTDNGPGISEENLRVIFDRFEQVGQTTKSSTKGFGLGLNIAQELVFINLGTMAVKSDLSNGSTFSFDVPMFDLDIIIKRYILYISRIVEGLPDIALFKIKMPMNADLQESDLVDDFLQQQLRRSDFLVQKDAGTWLLCTPQGRQELDETVKRYRNARILANDHGMSGDLPEISYENVGVWDLKTQSEEFFLSFGS